MTENQHLDYDSLNGLKEVMEDDFTFLIDTFLQDSATRLQELQALVNSTDGDAIRRAAHSFKGSCGNVGALYLASLLASLEHKGVSGSLNGIADDVTKITEEFELITKLLQDYMA